MTFQLEITIKADLLFFFEWLDEEILFNLPANLSYILISRNNEQDYRINNIHLRTVKDFEPYPHEDDRIIAGCLSCIDADGNRKIIEKSLGFAPIEVRNLSYETLQIRGWIEMIYLPLDFIDSTLLKEIYKNLSPILKYLNHKTKNSFEVIHSNKLNSSTQLPQQPEKIEEWNKIYKSINKCYDTYNNMNLDSKEVSQKCKWKDVRAFVINDLKDETFQIPGERTLRKIINAGKAGLLE